MARCRTRQQEITGAQRQACEGWSIRRPGLLQLLHNVSVRIFVFCRRADSVDRRLLFMTYNGWVMLAVALGAFVGYLAFGAGMTSTKSVACH